MTRRRIAAPPSPIPPVNLITIAAGTPLHRTHSHSLRAAQFNPCLGQATRFAPFSDDRGACVPSLYAASSREAAAFESIFHDIEPRARFKTVPLHMVEARQVSVISPRRDLALVKLFAPDLKAWKITRGRLIDTPKSTYAETALWAKAIHLAHRRVDGLVWTSRQCDPHLCVLLYGDRVNEEDFEVPESRHVGSDPALLLELRAYGARAGITIVS
jgi:RES domain